jgi:hypothetical protein
MLYQLKLKQLMNGNTTRIQGTMTVCKFPASRGVTYICIITGTWIWGRGTCDDKSDLIRQLLAVDSLLKQGFSPARTLILSYGFDEESKGIEVRKPSTYKLHY